MNFNPVTLIEKKRDGQELSSAEIYSFIEGVTSGQIEDYQTTAFLMATYFQGMTPEETVALTRAMLESGKKVDLSSLPGVKVDKHSTGGVGDKVSLILAPLAAACGLTVPMMAGRGLGHSGGTLDKLESIPGFKVRLEQSQALKILAQVGCVIIGQTDEIAPADKKLYSLRDVTGTVPCVPLICGSILSKKLAEGTDALVLDVKVGSGAFMKTLGEARNLSKSLIAVAKKLGLPARALITDMNQPLGYAVGNATEVIECVEVLRNRKPAGAPGLSSADLRELTLQTCAHMLLLGKKSKSLQDARKIALAKLQDGSAWQKFREMVGAQGGSLEWIDRIETQGGASGLAQVRLEWTARKRGYIRSMDTEKLGKILVELGGGRKKASDSVDPSVGYWLHSKLGDKVNPKDILATVFASPSLTHAALSALEADFLSAIEISSTRGKVPPLIHARVT
ncbi:MAG: thymidine phosphorylase [Oligoflexia bacterium]